MNHAYPDTWLIQKAGGAGILWWRDWSVKWQTVEPEAGKFDFRTADVQIDRVRKAGGKVVVLFPFPSSYWASSGDPQVIATQAKGNQYLASRLPAAFAAKKIDDFKRYIGESVKHYRDRGITVYEVLNEPLYTTYALPAAFGYKMSDYVAHLEAAWTAAKAADPKCLVIGGIGCGPGDGRAREFVESGGLKFCDIVDIHIYSAPSQFDYLEDSCKALAALMAKRGEPRPMWVTEFGVYADDDPAVTPPRTGDQTMERCVRSSEREASCDIVKLVSMFGAYGVEKVFFHAGTAPAINQPNAGGVFFEWGGAPRKMYAAAAVLARNLPPDARFVKADALGPGFKAYTYKTAAGLLTVAWSDEEGGRKLALRPGVAATDIMGNALDGKSVQVDGTPIYLTAKGEDASVFAPLP